MEAHVPTLFLDLLGDLSSSVDSDSVVATPSGCLFGEKEESMIDLPIINTEKVGVVGRKWVWPLIENMSAA